MLGSELNPISPPSLHRILRYKFGDAIPNSARLATVNGSSKTMRNQTTFDSRHDRGMNMRPIAGDVDVVADVSSSQSSQQQSSDVRCARIRS